MKRGFAERLDFVMGVTHTTNSSLARALSFDASYICRIRNGKRGLPRNQPFAEPAAAYLVSRVTDVRQQRALEEEIGYPWPADGRKAADLLAAWLLADAGAAPAVGHAIAALGMPMANGAYATPTGVAAARPSQRNQPSPCVSFHYGNAGKREAVRAFLSELAAEGTARELLLHSDEDMSWLSEDDAFAREWTALLLRVIGNGCRVRIVHTISRDANEMWEAVGTWMPLYMTGAVEPYYYPRLRDGVYRRTLFVAAGHSAIAAASVGDMADSLNMLVTDPDAVAAYEREFASYLALCRPLMNVSFPDGPRGLSEEIAAFAKERSGEALAMLEDGKLVCAWEEGPALVANTKRPRVVFGIDERLMAAAVWGYLQSLPNPVVRQGADARALLEAFVLE